MSSNVAMSMRRLGRTDFRVNVLGLGGHTYPVGYDSDCFLSPEARALLVRHLVSSGVNYFDTTYKEEVELLFDSFRRADIKDDVLISLWGGITTDRLWRQKLRKELETRLDILGYTDAPLFAVSIGDGEESYGNIVAACEAIARLKEERLARNIGVSCHAINLYPMIGRIIRETDMLDYIMVRFNWKYQQANEELFPIAEDHDVGIVGMKLFCWDCGPASWERRISVFEPLSDVGRKMSWPSLTPAQRHLLWCIQNSPCDVVVPSMNSMREANENLQAVKSLDAKVGSDDFEEYSLRLWNKEEIRKLALHAESRTIRERAEILLTLGRWWDNILSRTIKAHCRVLRNEGLGKYLLYSYLYRKEQLTGLINKVRTRAGTE